MIKEYLGKKPKTGQDVFIEESAQIIGDVEIEDMSSVWFNAVIRGDVNYIRIGKKTNIQDGSLLHVTHETHPLIIQDEVTIGHGVILHGCKIMSKVLIGMGAIVLDGAVIESNSIIGAGSVVTEGSEIPSGWLALGIPAKPKRKLTEVEIGRITDSADHYIAYSKNYFHGGK